MSYSTRINPALVGLFRTPEGAVGTTRTFDSSGNILGQGDIEGYKLSDVLSLISAFDTDEDTDGLSKTEINDGLTLLTGDDLEADSDLGEIINDLEIDGADTFEEKKAAAKSIMQNFKDFFNSVDAGSDDDNRITAADVRKVNKYDYAAQRLINGKYKNEAADAANELFTNADLFAALANDADTDELDEALDVDNIDNYDDYVDVEAETRVNSDDDDDDTDTDSDDSSVDTSKLMQILILLMLMMRSAQPAANPYAGYGQSADSYAGYTDPYASQGYGYADPYATQAQGYGYSDPYAAQGQGYGYADPYAAQGQGYGYSDPYSQQAAANNPFAQFDQMFANQFNSGYLSF